MNGDFNFSVWFKRELKQAVPACFYNFIKLYPNGVNWSNGELFGEDKIIDTTIDYQKIIPVGFCVIGLDQLGLYIMRAKDGKIFLVSKNNYHKTIAWFLNVNLLIDIHEVNCHD